MSDRPAVIYRYDGSFEGLMCCVFESYARHELPAEIVTDVTFQTTLYPVCDIPTDPVRAARVLQSIPRRISPAALDFVQRAFLTCLERRELYILRFLRTGYQVGSKVLDMLTDDVVCPLTKAVRQLGNEAHLLMGFVRFSDNGGALVAQIEPKNTVLPLLMPHFCARYPGERFLIYDKTHSMALVYEPGHAAIIPLDDLQLPEPDRNETAIRELWRLFYRTVEVEGRHNPRCRMSHMPKRYWKYLTELGGQPEAGYAERPYAALPGQTQAFSGSAEAIYPCGE